MGSLIMYSGRNLEHFCNKSRSKLASLYQYYYALISTCFQFLAFKMNPLWVQLAYFIVVSLFGFGALNMSKLRKTDSFRPTNFDMFFTSVSASTVSSMTAVEMEVFSNSQLVIMTVLMLLGGEVFVSMLGLQLARSRFYNRQSSSVNSSEMENEIPITSSINSSSDTKSLKYRARRSLGYVVLGYLLVVHVVGSSLVSMYFSFVTNAGEILKTKGIELQTFAFFTIVSTFASCGFVPTNENMIVFKGNSGLLLVLIPQVLMGNTLYPVCLRVLIWVLEKMTKREEFNYMLNHHKEMGYSHLLSGVRCFFIFATVLGFALVQLVFFCWMEWNSEAMDGLSWYQKFVGSLFEVVNVRHTGESIVDLSTMSSAILVLFVVMMYLPPYTSFVPTKYKKKESNELQEKEGQNEAKGKSILECFSLSHLSYLAFFIILICITERHKLKEDPLNFNVLNITIEVISAYGNVGFSSGYSCKRRLDGEKWCRDTWAGFVGRWSNSGKCVLIIVMFFGRLKNFTFKSGQAWSLS